MAAFADLLEDAPFANRVTLHFENGPVEQRLDLAAVLADRSAGRHRREVPGDPAFSAHLIERMFDAGFDPAFSMKLTLDHSMATPLELAGLAGVFPIVPLFVNCVQPPMPRMARCIQFGQALRTAIDAYDGVGRVVILATGGISHDVGTPRMGFVNEAFDREFLRLIENGEPEALAHFSQDQVDTAGNGAEEIRNWLVAHGLADCRPFQTFHYDPVTQWYTGTALGGWRLQ